jgi:hypothetical protein
LRLEIDEKGELEGGAEKALFAVELADVLIAERKPVAAAISYRPVVKVAELRRQLGRDDSTEALTLRRQEARLRDLAGSAAGSLNYFLSNSGPRRAFVPEGEEAAQVLLHLIRLLLGPADAFASGTLKLEVFSRNEPRLGASFWLDDDELGIVLSHCGEATRTAFVDRLLAFQGDDILALPPEIRDRHVVPRIVRLLAQTVPGPLPTLATRPDGWLFGVG